MLNWMQWTTIQAEPSLLGNIENVYLQKNIGDTPPISLQCPARKYRTYIHSRSRDVIEMLVRPICSFALSTYDALKYFLKADPCSLGALCQPHPITIGLRWSSCAPHRTHRCTAHVLASVIHMYVHATCQVLVKNFCYIYKFILNF